MNLTASGLAVQVPAVVELHPDAIRLQRGITPTGMPLGTHARLFVGDGWRQGTITATGTTWVQFSMQRHGTTTAYDRRNILLAHEWKAYEAACRKWRRDHQQLLEADA